MKSTKRIRYHLVKCALVLVTSVSLSLFFNLLGCDLGVSRAFCQVIPACRGA